MPYPGVHATEGVRRPTTVSERLCTECCGTGIFATVWSFQMAPQATELITASPVARYFSGPPVSVSVPCGWPMHSPPSSAGRVTRSPPHLTTCCSISQYCPLQLHSFLSLYMAPYLDFPFWFFITELMHVFQTNLENQIFWEKTDLSGIHNPKETTIITAWPWF